MGGRLIARRRGVLGGTFDPVHYAHLAIAEQVADALSLDEVLFVPARQPVHRSPPVASAEQRAEMVALAVSDNPRFVLNRIELEATESNYSVDTIARLRHENPDDEFLFIVSAEAAAQLSTWREPDRLLELSRLVVVPRLGYPVPDIATLARGFEGREDRFVIVATSMLGHSATDIRARRAHGQSIRYLVPPAVEEYIREHGLYAPA